MNFSRISNPYGQGGQAGNPYQQYGDWMKRNVAPMPQSFLTGKADPSFMAGVPPPLPNQQINPATGRPMEAGVDYIPGPAGTTIGRTISDSLGRTHYDANGTPVDPTRYQGQTWLSPTGGTKGGTRLPQNVPFGGARAKGGRIDPRKAYLTGEEGPELVVPDTPSVVIPARQTAQLLSQSAPDPNFASKLVKDANGNIQVVADRSKPVFHMADGSRVTGATKSGYLNAQGGITRNRNDYSSAGMGRDDGRRIGSRAADRGGSFSERNAGLSPDYNQFTPRRGSGLSSFDAQKSIDPVTGLSMEPSTFELDRKRRELSKAGEWDALARMNAYYRARESGDAGAIGDAADSINNFRAIRQAKQQQFATAQAGQQVGGAYAPDTRPAGDFSAIPASDFVPVRQGRAFDDGSLNGPLAEGETRRIYSPYGSGSSRGVARGSGATSEAVDVKGWQDAVREIDNTLALADRARSQLPRFDAPPSRAEALLGPPVIDNLNGASNVLASERAPAALPMRRNAEPTAVPAPRATAGAPSDNVFSRSARNFGGSPIGEALGDVAGDFKALPSKYRSLLEGYASAAERGSAPARDWFFNRSNFKGSDADKWLRRTFAR